MLDKSMRAALSQLNVINWVDFYSWRRDYDLGQRYELMKGFRKKERPRWRVMSK